MSGQKLIQLCDVSDGRLMATGIGITFMFSAGESSLERLMWQLFVKQVSNDDITELQNAAAHI
jgi:hypothetical protein